MLDGWKGGGETETACEKETACKMSLKAKKVETLQVKPEGLERLVLGKFKGFMMAGVLWRTHNMMEQCERTVFKKY